MDDRDHTQSEHRPRVAFVQSCWHKDLVDQIKKGFAEESAELGVPADNIDFLR